MRHTKGGSTQRYIWPWMRMVCRSEWLSRQVPADCTQACKLIEGFDAGYILVDRGYDSNSFIEYIEEHDMEAVIPPRKNRKIQRGYDHYLYRYRHLIENTFVELKK